MADKVKKDEPAEKKVVDSIAGLVPEGRFPLMVALAASFLVSIFAFSTAAKNCAGVGVMLALMMAAALVGALIGFLFGAPGMEPTDAGLAAGQSKGWGGRIGVIGNWLAGAAFTLLITNGDKLLDAFLHLLRYATGAEGKDPSTVETRSMVVAGAGMVVWFAIGFITGFLQMVTNGRAVITSAEARAELRLALLKRANSPVVLAAESSGDLSGKVGTELTVKFTITNRSEAAVRLNAAGDTAAGLVVDPTNATAVAGAWSALELAAGATATAEVKVTPQKAGPFLLKVRANGSFLSQEVSLKGTAG